MNDDVWIKGPDESPADYLKRLEEGLADEGVSGSEKVRLLILAGMARQGAFTPNVYVTLEQSFTDAVRKPDRITMGPYMEVAISGWTATEQLLADGSIVLATREPGGQWKVNDGTGRGLAYRSLIFHGYHCPADPEGVG